MATIADADSSRSRASVIISTPYPSSLNFMARVNIINSVLGQNIAGLPTRKRTTSRYYRRCLKTAPLCLHLAGLQMIPKDIYGRTTAHRAGNLHPSALPLVKPAPSRNLVSHPDTLYDLPVITISALPPLLPSRLVVRHAPGHPIPSAMSTLISCSSWRSHYHYCSWC